MSAYVIGVHVSAYAMGVLNVSLRHGRPCVCQPASWESRQWPYVRQIQVAVTLGFLPPCSFIVQQVRSTALMVITPGHFDTELAVQTEKLVLLRDQGLFFLPSLNQGPISGHNPFL